MITFQRLNASENLQKAANSDPLSQITKRELRHYQRAFPNQRAK